MDERQFLIELAFKPLVPDLQLTPEQSQLILAYVGEILGQLEAEQIAASDEENTPCK